MCGTGTSAQVPQAPREVEERRARRGRGGSCHIYNSSTQYVWNYLNVDTYTGHGAQYI